MTEAQLNALSCEEIKDGDLINPSNIQYSPEAEANQISYELFECGESIYNTLVAAQ